jgi:hypothetical protein
MERYGRHPWWVGGTHIVQRLAPATKVETM